MDPVPQIQAQIQAPEGLRALQSEFGRSIREPFSFATGRFACRTRKYSAFAAEAILTRGTQGSRERLAVYNEQYWYRLLTAMQEHFPLLGAGMGLWRFNRLATAFMVRYPSRHPFLERLATGFPAFLREDRPRDIRSIQSADLDFAFIQAFHAPGLPSLDPARLTRSESESLEDAPLRLQPWLSLCKEDWNLMECRTRLMEGFPEKPAFRAQKNHWAIIRKDARVDRVRLTSDQFRLLKELADGCPLGEACLRTCASSAQAGKGGEDSGGGSLAGSLSGWFSQWTAWGWFVHPAGAGLLTKKRT
ncbi:MAG: DNA-binding domain-containing protein [Fibrobacteria bacterium]